jgi:hypothetical protein
VIAAEKRVAVLKLSIARTPTLNAVMLFVNANEFANPNVVALITQYRARYKPPVRDS